MKKTLIKNIGEIFNHEKFFEEKTNKIYHIGWVQSWTLHYTQVLIDQKRLFSIK